MTDQADEASLEGFGSVVVGNRHRGDVGLYVGRGTVYGNPYSQEDQGRLQAIENYGEYLQACMRDPASPLRRAIHTLAKRVSMGERLTLVCSCAPAPCHAQVLRQVILPLARELHARRA